jgi:Helix-loop-helix DNA-binding domain
LQAEARRRSRINERLDALRKLVPHTERANTAAFLEDVVRYIQRVQHRVLELELKLGLPPTVTLPAQPITFGDSATPEGTLVTTTSQGGIDRVALHAVLQQAAATVAAMPAAAGPSSGGGGGPGGAAAAVVQASNAPVLPSVSEELAMAAQLAPPLKNDSVAEKATMAESQPPAAHAAAAAAAATAVTTAPAVNNHAANGVKRHQVGTQQPPVEFKEEDGYAAEHPTKRRKGTERKQHN